MPGTLLSRITPLNTRSRFRLLEWRTVLIHTWQIEAWTVDATDPETTALAAAVASTGPADVTITYTGEHLNQDIIQTLVAEALTAHATRATTV